MKLNDASFAGKYLVVMLIENADNPQEIANNFQQKYQGLLTQGLLEIVIPTTKQNGATPKSQSQLLHIVSNRCGKYLQSDQHFQGEDGFLSTIQEFVAKIRHNDWIYISFGNGQGLTGKLLSCDHLPSLTKHLRNTAPHDIDTSLQEYVDAVYPPCDLSKADITQNCKQELGRAYYHYRPSLFVRRLDGPRDPDIAVSHEPFPWEDVPVYLNPKARLSTTMKEIDGHTLSSAYNLDGYLLVEPPVAGDVIFVNFTPPVPIEELFLRSWHSGHPNAHFTQCLSMSCQYFPRLQQAISLSRWDALTIEESRKDNSDPRSAELLPSEFG
jgi:hypothetical protein